MRATIKEVSANRVRVEESNELDERVTTEYYAPDGGGYVRIDDGIRYPQVCEGLGGSGATLRWSGDGSLVSLIRREYKSGKASYRRMMDRI